MLDTNRNLHKESKIRTVTQLQLQRIVGKIFSYFSTKRYVVCTHNISLCGELKKYHQLLVEKSLVLYKAIT